MTMSKATKKNRRHLLLKRYSSEFMPTGEKTEFILISRTGYLNEFRSALCKQFPHAVLSIPDF
ncbi:UNVERIFIED_CONTAM: hypothetical protein NCL1_19373 [Trichonephila clavipes]